MMDITLQVSSHNLHTLLHNIVYTPQVHPLPRAKEFHVYL